MTILGTGPREAVTLLGTTLPPRAGRGLLPHGKSLAPANGAEKAGAGMCRAKSPSVTLLRRRNPAQQGFTLAELLVVIAMIAVMSALAVVGYKKYINSAQSSEARAMIQGIRVGEEAYKSEMLVYLGCTTDFSTYYPHTPDDHKMNWANAGPAYAACWQLINVQSDGPVRFGYAVVAGIAGKDPMPATGFVINGYPPVLVAGTPWYVIQAKNQRPGSPKPIYFVSVSTSSELFVQNDDQ